MLTPDTHLLQHGWRIAIDTEAGRQHQKDENQQKPGTVIDIIEPKDFEYFKPELPELHDVVGIRFVLL